MKKHEGLVGDKNVYRMKIRAAKKKVAEKKQKKKDFKKTAKKSTADPKKAKETKKKANNKKFKLVMARLDRTSAKEHRHSLRVEDRATMKKVKAMQKKIFEVSGIRFKRPSITSELPKWRVAEIQAKKAKKVKRAEKAVKTATKKLKKAKATGDKKKIAKLTKKIKKSKVQIVKRAARLEHFKKKTLRNKDVAAEKKLKKAVAKKA